MGRTYVVTGDEAGAWSVVDAESEMPAVLNDVPQVGLARDEAEAVAASLNRVVDDEDG